MTEFPRLNLKWNVTQVIDNPEYIVDGYRAPLYLSPEVSVEEGYFENKYSKIKDVRLEVYDVNKPARVIAQTSPAAYREDSPINNFETYGSGSYSYTN